MFFNAESKKKIKKYLFFSNSLNKILKNSENSSVCFVVNYLIFSEFKTMDIKFFEGMWDGFAYCKLAVDPSDQVIDYRYLMVNPGFETLLGLKRESVIGKLLREVTPELAVGVAAGKGPRSKLLRKTRTVKKELYFPQSNRWGLIYSYIPEEDHLVIIINDITDFCNRQADLTKQNQTLLKRNERLRKKLLQPYRTSVQARTTEPGGSLEKAELGEEVARLLCEASNEGLWYWDIREDKLILIGAWYRQLNYKNFDPIINHRQWSAKIHPEDLPKLRRVFENYLQGDLEQCRCQYRLRNSSGEYQWVELTGKALFGQDGQAYVMAGAHLDISQNKQPEAIELPAYYDNLTNLPNLMMFKECLRNAIVVSRRHHTKSVVIFLRLTDQDHIFKNQGSLDDQLVTLVAKRLLKLTRSYEIVARLKDSEFAFILQGVHENNEIIGFCERLRVSFADSLELNGRRIKLNLSLEVAVYPEDGLDPEDLLFNSETALDSLKTYTNDNWQFFKPVIQEDVTRKKEIRKRIRKALEQKRFSLAYQPEIEMKTGKIRAMEALLRWREPGLGWVAPLEFIPFMEESGLIVPLGEWVLHEACRQNVWWWKNYGIELIVAVNISSIQLKQSRFVTMVKEVLAATGMKPKLLELEITESVLIHSYESVVNMLGELRQLGVRISLDDFGTGYSWLSYLKKLPLDTLKIDKSIISDIHYDIRGKEIIEAIVEMVRKLGLTTVAEGVEHQKQLDCLRLSNCDCVQGFLLGKPLPATEVVGLIQHNFLERA
jgi:diguanylate cyclase (GGDEF)-like protein/PAS domain S-box-containing protein